MALGEQYISKKKIRSSNIELMRIVLMFIIMHHYVVVPSMLHASASALILHAMIWAPLVFVACSALDYLRMYWESVVLRRLLGDQMSDALGLISVAIIVVGLTMVLAVAWDKWQIARLG